MSARFAEKVILITGGTSGMGRALAERVASEGAKVGCTRPDGSPDPRRSRRSRRSR
ncbi:SDR family NAD(P)-dependent oxidoreductase [Sphaerisporangium rhizosphaerae]|uniref:SDR family NAD(P)-dependent oxidoreductase n=1 Tax=Sphaerisporangium rhizosphaerae TaxID=2269375 RepID=A0ABW2P5G1_9ACTN